jgi:MFS family permease
MKRTEREVYFLLILVSTASSQQFYLPVYFEKMYNDTELAFVLVTIAITLRAFLAPFIAQILKNFVKLNIIAAFSFQSIFYLILYLNVPLNLTLVIILGVLYGIVSSLILFLNAVYFSYSEPTFSSRYRSANFFISSKFIGYTIGSIISAIVLFFYNLADLFIIASIFWLFSVPLVLTLKIEKTEVRKPDLRKVKETLFSVSPLLLISFVFSMSLAAVGGLIEPLIFNKINAGWFSISFILANIASSLVPIYFPKNKILLSLTLGTFLAVITEFLFPLTPFLYLLIIYGILSQIGNSLVWPVVIGKIVSRSKFPIVESGVLITLTDLSSLIADGYVSLSFPLINTLSLSLFSIIDLFGWLPLLLRKVDIQ